jgi:hypothetical protein
MGKCDTCGKNSLQNDIQKTPLSFLKGVLNQTNQ